MSRSPVWNYFTKTKDKKKVRCKTCGSELSFLNSTTNMISHMKNVHKIVLSTLQPKGGKQKRSIEIVPRSASEDEDNPPKRASIGSAEVEQEVRLPTSSGDVPTGPLVKCVNNMRSFAAGQTRDAQCTNALLYMIAVDTMPLCTPERKGFKIFVQTLQPQYSIPSEPTLTRRMEEKYQILRSRVADELQNAEVITLTFDLWTHKNTMRGYLGCTAHFRKGTEIMSIELGARLMDERKTIANLRAALGEICSEWKIEHDRVKAVVTDGGANVKAASKAEFGADKHISCFAHQLNVIAQKAIGNVFTVPSEQQSPEPDVADIESDIDDEAEERTERDVGSANTLRELLIKVKKIVRFFKHSEVATSKLLALQRTEFGKTENKCLKLIQEVKTRWNSCFSMIDRYLVLAPLLTRVLYEIQREKSSKSKPPELITADEEETLKEVRDLLAPLDRATKELSTDKNFTLSKCIPVIKNLKRDISKFLSTTPIAFNLQQDVLRFIHEKFANIEEIKMFAASTLLDPRFKKVGFTKDERTPIRVANAISFVGYLVKAKMREASTPVDLPVEDAFCQPPVGEDTCADNFWGDFDKEVKEHSVVSSGQDIAGGIPVTLRTYLDSPPVSRAENPNPVLAWETFKGEYKYVHKVAQEYLSILATSVPSERLFSHAGLIASQLRTRLSGKHLEMLVFLRSCDQSLWFR